MKNISYSDGRTVPAVVEIWDAHPGYRAYWVQPGASTGSPVFGYASGQGGPHKTVRAAAAEVLRYYPGEEIYRNGKLLMKKNPIGKHRTTVGGSGPAGMTCVKYHATNVVCFNDREIILDSGGWKTATTKKRINQAADEFGFGFSVVQRQGTWWVQFYDGRAAKHFEDGMRIARVQKNPIKERIAAARHARAIRRTPGGRQLARSVIAYGRGRGLLSKNPVKRERIPSNIEKLPGKSHWTGYANGVWIIKKWGTTGMYRAVRQDGRGWPLFAHNLRLMGLALKDAEKHSGGVPSSAKDASWSDRVKTNPHRRTNKKKLSPKQAAWRKEFARRVKAGLYRKNPGRKFSRRRIRAEIKKSTPLMSSTERRSFLKRVTRMKPGRPLSKNPVRSKLLALKHKSGKWWYLAAAGNFLTDNRGGARKFATDAAAIATAQRIKKLLTGNGIVTAETR